VSERGIRIALGVVAVVGAAICIYLLAVRETGSHLVCSTGGCEAVQRSSYSELLGIPVAALGLGAYVALGLCALLSGERARMAGAVIAVAGAVFSIYLLGAQVFSIDAICQWCVTSDLLMTAAAGLCIWRLRVAAPVTA
jgi:uncharacterized membrane protein